MIKTLYICDICNTEKGPDEIFGLIPACIPFDQDPPVEVVKILGNRHVCVGCLKKLFHEEEEKPEKKERKKPDRSPVKALSQDRMDEITGKKKRWYTTKADEEEIIRLYREGKEIEEISDIIHVAMPPISKVVVKHRLGEERDGIHAAV